MGGMIIKTVLYIVFDDYSNNIGKMLKCRKKCTQLPSNDFEITDSLAKTRFYNYPYLFATAS